MSPVLRLRFRHLAGTSPVPLGPELATLHSAFERAQVTFRVENDDVQSTPLSEPIMNFVRVGECEGVTLTEQQTALFARVDAGPPCLFFVVDISKGEGCAIHPSNQLGAIVRRDHSHWTTAHEVGHLFGLDHRGGVTCLMHDVPKDIVPEGGASAPELNDDELATIADFFANAPAGRSLREVTSARPEVPASRWTPLLDVRTDAVDLRDRIYEPGLKALPTRLPPDSYLRAGVPVLHQGDTGACTGYALATVIHYLLRTREGAPDTVPVSPRMLFEMARAYDEWVDDQLPGASPRATLKGWSRHGVCADALWNMDTETQTRTRDTRVRQQQLSADAATRPLGAYFRLRHDDLTAMHSALREHGPLLATCTIHRGWRKVSTRSGVIPGDRRELGHHAFAIVGYDEHGFWIQNSWGDRWGRGGLALLPYDDWIAHGLDVWAVQLGVPVAVAPVTAVAVAGRPIVALDQRGRLRSRGDLAVDARSIASWLRSTPSRAKEKRPPDLLLHFPCGECDESRIVKACEALTRQAEAAGMRPLSMLWTSGIALRLESIIREELAHRGADDATVTAASHWHTRWDDSVEALVRRDGARFWGAIKTRAVEAIADPYGGVRVVAEQIAGHLAQHPRTRLHLACHGTGALPVLQLVQFLTTRGPIAEGPLAKQSGLGLRVDSLTFWRPACSIHLFKRIVWPAVEAGAVARVRAFTSDRADARRPLVPGLYARSLLQVISAALERAPKRSGAVFGSLEQPGVPVLGLADHVRRDPALRTWFKRRGCTFRDVESESGSGDALLPDR